MREATGRSVGKIVRLGDLDWQSHADFIRSIEGRIPIEREMITPVDLSRAPELRLVYRGSLVDAG